jgi:branched-chain amino acid transport system ATP-binding protein
MLRLTNVEVMFNKVILVLRGVSLDVPDGSIVALLGANGAGKTTTLNAITGLIKTELGEVTEGTIEFEGQNLNKMATEKIAQIGIAQVMEGRRLFAHLSVEENLRVGARAKRERRSRASAYAPCHGRLLFGRRTADDLHRPCSDQ